MHYFQSILTVLAVEARPRRFGLPAIFIRRDAGLLPWGRRRGRPHLIHRQTAETEYLDILLFVVVGLVIVIGVAWITKSTSLLSLRY